MNERSESDEESLSEGRPPGLRRVLDEAGPLLVGLAVFVVVAHYHLSTVSVSDAGHWHTSDDAMITLRVAQNFYETGLPYYNDGEAVAANTSLFWPMVLAGVFAIFDNEHAIPAIMAISAAMSVATAIVASSLVADIRARVLTAGAILLTPTFFKYGSSGWEHVPQMLLVTLSMVAIWRASAEADRFKVPTRALICISLAFLFRVDSAPSVAAVGLAWLVTEERYRRAGSWALLAVLAILPAAYLGLMQYYYGAFRPNTAVLKMIDRDERIDIGLLYLRRPDFSGIVPLLLPLLLILRPVSAAGWFITGVVALHAALVVYVGGDVFSLGRFFMLYLPITIALVVATVATRAGYPGLRGRYAAMVAPCVLLLAWHAPYLVDRSLLATAGYGSSKGNVERMDTVRLVSEVLTPEDGSIGLHYLGMGYHVPEFHVVDFLGKAEPVIARAPVRGTAIGHNKWDYAYAFSTYNIAAVPMLDDYVTGKRPENPADAPFDFWAQAVIALRGEGYAYLEPEFLGNSEGGIGLFVRPDLVPRFEAHMATRDGRRL